MRLGHKLILAFLAVALLFCASAYLAISASQKALRKSIGRNSVSFVTEVMNEIDMDIGHKIEILQEYAKDLILRKSLFESNRQFEQLDNIQSYINEKNEAWIRTSREEVTPFMQELTDNRLAEELRQKIKFYKDKYGYEVFGEVFVTNKYGANIAQTGKTTDYKQADEEWWQRAKRDGLYVSDVEYDKSAGIYSITVGVRADDEDGNFTGVIKAVLNIEEVLNVIEEAKAASKYRTARLILINKDKKLICSMKNKSGILEDGTGLIPPSVKAGRSGYFVTEGKEPNKKKKLFAYAQSAGYGDFDGLGWILIVDYGTEEIFAPVARLRNDILIISLVATALAVLLGLYVSSSISDPIKKLRDAAASIGEGDLDTAIEVKSNDEIGELAASFNDMAGKLKESHAQLEEKVKGHTAELSSANVKLEGEIEQRSSAQKTLEKRIRELDCLFGLSKLVEQPGISLEEIFAQATNLICNAYQYPDKTCVRTTFEGVKYETDNFERSDSSQYADIKVRDEKTGKIEVYYLGEKEENSQKPFLKEEQDLLNAIAKRLGSVAERMQARQKLQLFRNLIDQSNDAVFVIEPEWGRFLDVNDKACDSLGYTRQELLQMTVKDIENVIPNESAWAEHAKEVRKKGAMVLEGRHKRKDGVTFPVEVNSRFIKQNGDSYMLAVARDITKRKQAEEKLKQAAEEWIITFNSIADLVSIHDKNFNLVRVNKAFADAFGMDPEELIGKKCYEVVHGTKEPPRYCPHKRTLDTKKPQRADFFEPNLGIYVEASASPVFDENEEVVGSAHITKDITQRKQAEERQAELLKQVESINKELKDFAYIVSHDLKAPLRGIRTLADWISTDYSNKLDEEGKEQINLLNNRVDRMHGLIDGVLQYSRVGREKEKCVMVNLNELVPAIIDSIAPPENITITIENELPLVECQETRIIQVFQNLLSNAVKYMDKPDGQIRIGCVEEADFWKFSVADNGPGIEEKHFERIFKIFQTLVPRDEVESTGVGLAVVKKIIEMYGGKIWVESKVGQGSTFFFTLAKQEMGVKNEKLETNIVS